ncbi:unnamed protein product [Coregonus sp. 'balchen']|nr:unnamed protein product [Coregonus sp. 'balchen']
MCTKQLYKSRCSAENGRAALWQVVQRRDVVDYGLVEEFVTTVLDIVPDLMSYREKVQLIMGLRAQLVLELCRSDQLADRDTVQPHLNRMKTCIITHGDNKKVFPEEFGPKYDSALKTLVWEFLSSLEKLLPTPTLQQTASCFLPDPSVLMECVQSVSHPQSLRTLLQYHTKPSPGPHVEANALSGDDHILSSPPPSPLETVESSTDQADPEIQSEPVQGFMTIQRPASSDIESEMTPSLEYRESGRGMNLDRSANVDILPLNEAVEPAFVNKETAERNVNDGTLDKESAEEWKMDEAFLRLHTDSGLKIQGRVCSQPEVQDISSLSTSGRLRQPIVLLQRLDVTDMLLPEVSSTQRRERLQLDKVGSQGPRGGRVISQKSERNVNGEPSDSKPQCSLVPGPSHTKGQPKISKRVKICSFCGKTFREAKDLTAHMRTHTEQSPRLIGQDFDLQDGVAVQPEEDNMSAASSEDWTETPQDTLPQRRRVKSQHGKPRQSSKVSKCSLCDRTFSKVAHSRQHMRYTHGKLLCLNCGEGFENSDFEKHKEECLKTKKRLSCPLCGDTFELSEPNEDVNQQRLPREAHPDASTLLAAVENVEMEIPLPSNATPQNPTTSNALPFQLANNYRTCLLCKEAFDNGDDLRMHLKCQHDVLPYPCFKCGESFQSTFDWQKHLNECSGQNIPDFRKCPGCRTRTCQYTQQGMTSQEVNFKRHQTHWPLHTEENEIPQEVDPADGSTRGNGIETFQPHSTEPQNPTTCDASPTLPRGVDLDSRTCHVCSKSFRRKQSLTLHLRRHGEGAIKCPICSKCFGRNRDLKFHLANKTGCGPMRRNRTVVIVPTKDTPVFTCSDCLQQFTSENKLKLHTL